MRLSLVSIHCNRSPEAFPLAAAVLAAQLQHEIVPSLLDLYLDESLETSCRRILETAPEVLGFSVYLWNCDVVKEVAGEIHRRAPHIVLIAGGPEITAAGEVFDPEGIFTALFAGEGEKNLLSFLTAADEPPSGRLFKQLSPLDVSALASPFLRGTVDVSRYDGILWELSRGCVFNCSFCFESRGIRQVRAFPLNQLKKELDHFVDHHVSQIFVLDPTFNLNPDRAKKLLRIFKERAPEIHFSFEVRSEFLDTEMADLFASLTCSVQLGLQSIHPHVLSAVNRQFNKDDFYEKVLLLHEAGAVYGFDLIYGLPEDTFTGFCESVDFALSLRPNHLDLFPLAVLKGTELYGSAEKYKLTYRTTNPYTVLHTPRFPDTDMEKAGNLAQACAVFYNRGEAVPWFALILEALGEAPSTFLMAFARYLVSEGIREDDSSRLSLMEVTELQTRFVYSRFAGQSMEREGLAASDIIQWFNGVSYLKSCEERSSLVMDFTCNIETIAEYIEIGIDSLEELTFFTEQSPCRGELYKAEGEVFTRIIESGSNMY